MSTRPAVFEAAPVLASGRISLLYTFNFEYYSSVRLSHIMGDGNKRDGDSSPRLEGTLALIKPDAYPRRIEIEEVIMKEGFLLVDKKRLKFTKELAEEFYEEHKNKPFFKDLIQFMTSGDCMAMCLGRENGIEHWRSLIGPTKVSEAKKSAPKSIRSVFGDPTDDMKNAVHGSDSPAAAGREIDLIFPNIIADSEGINFSERSFSRLFSFSTSLVALTGAWPT